MSTKTMKAIVINGDKAAVRFDHPIPALRDDYLLVKPIAIALNPTDWKSIAGSRAAPNGISGCDYAGTVVSVGSKVAKHFNPGDRICGCAHGANYSNASDGVFAEYAVVKGDVQMHTPAGLTDEQAATVGLGAITCGLGLVRGLGLRMPDAVAEERQGTEKGEWVLIYGGSSATGSLGIQFARLAGYKVITTCSQRNHEFVKSLGVSAVFDYSDPTCGTQIREHTSNTLKYAWDTIGLSSSAQICADALSTEPGCRYGTILFGGSPRNDVEVSHTLMYTMFGERFEKVGKVWEVEDVAADYAFAKIWMGTVEELLATGRLKAHPERVGKGGLQGALEGMREMKEGGVSGVKLVYRVGETP